MKLKLTFKYVLFSLFIFLINGCKSLPVQKETVQNPLHNYFMEIALGSEFGCWQPKIRKWNQDIFIAVKGQPTLVDMQTLKQVMDELSALTKLKIKFTEKEKTNIEIYFVPESEFKHIEWRYKIGNTGFFWTWWNPFTSNIYRARILISTTAITQQERNHVIYEELTQSLGLMNDSNHYADSIFYQPWSLVAGFSDIDKAIIQLLYHHTIRAGMNNIKVIKALN